MRAELVSSIVAELDEMRYTMASVAYAVQDHLLETSDEFLDWVLPIIRAYEGPRASLRLAETVAKLRATEHAIRIEALRAHAVPGRGLALKEYGVPFTTSKAAELRVCTLIFQRGIFSVVGKVDLFNQQVRYLQRQAELTFDNSLSDTSSDAVEDNLERGTRQLGEMARGIANDISQFIQEHGKTG